MRALFRALCLLRERQASRWVVHSKNIECDDVPMIKGAAYIVNFGRCKVGKNLLIRSGFKYNPTGLRGGGFILIIEKGAVFSVGDNVGMSNCTIYCRQSISIGNGTLIGTDCKIYDSDFHSTNHADRAARPEIPGKCAPVEVGNDVFIGTGSIILKGVKIGDRSVIGAGAVVSTSVPSDELWGGNPAKKIRSLLEC
jgi:acetyltransferase-like isoleucine patch superfamily enzyme